MSLLEVSEATQIIHDAAGDDANIIFGAVLDDSMEDEIMVTVIATGFNSRPKYTGLSLHGEVPRNNSIQQEAAKPRVERITQPMEEPAYGGQALRETTMDAHDDEEEIPLPKIERMYKPRGTLTEKDRRETYERGSVDLVARSGAAIRSNAEHVGNIARLTPKSDTKHVPSGPRDLKDFDQPAYLRRGITLPPIEETEDEQQVVAEPARPERREESPRNRDDRPAFLKRIMD